MSHAGGVPSGFERNHRPGHGRLDRGAELRRVVGLEPVARLLARVGAAEHLRRAHVGGQRLDEHAATVSPPAAATPAQPGLLRQLSAIRSAAWPIAAAASIASAG